MSTDDIDLNMLKGRKNRVQDIRVTGVTVTRYVFIGELLFCSDTSCYGFRLEFETWPKNLLGDSSLKIMLTTLS